jgi:hypothetical protein
VRPAVGQHFDPALIDPFEYAKLIRHAVLVPRIFTAEPVIGDNRCAPFCRCALCLRGRIPALRAVSSRRSEFIYMLQQELAESGGARCSGYLSLALFQVTTECDPFVIR